MKLRNKYYIMRHGQAISNEKEIVSCWPEKFYNPMTKLGKESVEESAKKLADKKIDMIFSSPLLRTKETAEIVAKKLKVKIKFDKRLEEEGFGIFNGGPSKDLESFAGQKARIRKKMRGGETYVEIFKRLLSFLKEINKKYKEKNILIISHQTPLFLLEGYVKGFSLTGTLKEFPPENMLRKGEFKELN